eukprot:TRINITY_DN3757_c0_g1_i1.p1 TRINITY_DN3757_c0_g1~~TRINITY_DN3757_c0_g1_i1.p1  ORF type:complete len:485 (-),score=97.69 TRINITY_DN3757_c0_g1_i1:155-1609(-)
MLKVKKPAVDARIIKLRNNEQRIQRMCDVVKECQNLHAVADWENKTDNKLKEKEMRRRFEDLRKQREERLDDRRQRLAEKLMQEEQDLQEELMNNTEGPEERRRKMAERAYQLSAEREKERQQLAQELMDRHFRENCDPLREVYSKKILDRTVDQRQTQVDFRQEMNEEIMQEKKLYEHMYELERLKKEERYLMDKRRAREQKEEFMRTLDRQVQQSNERKQLEDDEHSKDVAMLKADWAAADEAAKQAAEDAREKSRQLAHTLKSFNLEKQLEIQQRDDQERSEDMQYLRQVLEREDAEERREEELKDRRKEEMRKYQEHLALLAVKERENTDAQDEYIAKYAEQQAAKQDAIWKHQADCRQELAHEVQETRQQQIENKRRQQEVAYQLEMEEQSRLKEEEHEMARLENEYKHELRRKALQQQLDLETQIVGRAHIKATLERERRNLDGQQEIDENYMNRVHQMAESYEPPKYFGRKKVEWFH